MNKREINLLLLGGTVKGLRSETESNRSAIRLLTIMVTINFIWTVWITFN